MKEAFTRRAPHPWTNHTTTTRATTGIAMVTIRTTNLTMSDTTTAQTRTITDTTTTIIAMTRRGRMTMTGDTMTMIGTAMIGVVTPTSLDDTAMIVGDMMTMRMMAGLGMATVALATVMTITTRMMTKTTSHTRNEATTEHQATRSVRWTMWTTTNTGNQASLTVTGTRSLPAPAPPLAEPTALGTCQAHPVSFKATSVNRDMTGFQEQYFSRKRTFQQYLYNLFLAGTCILMWDEVTLNLFLKLITDTDSIIKALLYKPKLFHVFCRLFYTWILFLYDV